jgi:hypothetical protein
MDDPERDPVEEAIDTAGLRSFIESRPDFKDVIRKAIEAHPLLAQTEVRLQEEWHGHLWKHREWLTNLTYQGAAAFDRTLIALASGGIALSITFLNVFGPSPAITPTLLTAWIALVASILLTVLSMATSRWSVHAEIAAVDDLIKHPISLLEKPKRNEALPRRAQWLAWTTIALSVAAGVAFVAGLIALICFAAEPGEGSDARAATGPEAAEAQAAEPSAAPAAEGEAGLRAAASSAAPAAAPAAAEAGAVDRPED